GRPHRRDAPRGRLLPALLRRALRHGHRREDRRDHEPRGRSRPRRRSSDRRGQRQWRRRQHHRRPRPYRTIVSRLPLVLLLLLGCAKEEGASAPVGGDTSTSLTPAEVAQGVGLCEAYVTRVCRCAEKDAELKETCELARGQPEALKMSVHLSTGGEGAISTR